MRVFNEISIDSLNDDCLLLIFELLSIQDRLKIELVCQRWQKLCSLLWRKVHTFEASCEEFGCIVPEASENDALPALVINGPICKQIFEKCYSNLRMVNLSRVEQPKTMNLTDMWHDCSNDFYHEELLTGTLDHLKNLLLECKNLEELWMCRCVVNADDEFLSKLFDNNRHLRKLMLIELELTGECFSHLSTEFLKSFIIFDCVVLQPQYLNSTLSRAYKLHTLNLECSDKDPQTWKVVNSPVLSCNLMGYNEIAEFDYRCGLLYNICSVKNLTILGLRNSDLTNNMLRIISLSCANLKVLDIDGCQKVSNVGLSYIQSMSNMKCLNIGSIDRISNPGLLYINKNLQVLRIPDTEFSEKALVKLLPRLLQQMEVLEDLDISRCMQLNNRFIESVIDIVRLRRRTIPLEIGVQDTGVDIKLLGNICPLVKLNDHYYADYGKYC
ncbi:hypothetical protein QAD02_004516 [Eretmocerus hayati]|uniref:Uncharacterized protein n=1 Tax=Eretmocerus hayati TaxID=131215 RepID=A0ACC2NPQ7_9HYME|nr:hypothetical protein QAD02_004516 [Eretmocerus hayati]